MRFILILSISFAAAVTASPRSPDTGSLIARQQCTVDCTCLGENGTRSFPDTQRCCSPNGGTLDIPVCNILFKSSSGSGLNSVQCLYRCNILLTYLLFSPERVLPRHSSRFGRGRVWELLRRGRTFRMPYADMHQLNWLGGRDWIQSEKDSSLPCKGEEGGIGSFSDTLPFSLWRFVYSSGVEGSNVSQYVSFSASS